MVMVLAPGEVSLRQARQGKVYSCQMIERQPVLIVGETTAVRVLEEMGKVVGRVMVQAAETVLVVEALVAEVQVQGVDPGADLVVGLAVGLVQVVVLA